MWYNYVIREKKLLILDVEDSKEGLRDAVIYEGVVWRHFKGLFNVALYKGAPIEKEKSYVRKNNFVCIALEREVRRVCTL